MARQGVAPGGAAHYLASPRLASPRLASPGLAWPGLATPRLASADITPHFTSAHLTFHHLTSPQLTSRHHEVQHSTVQRSATEQGGAKRTEQNHAICWTTCCCCCRDHLRCSNALFILQACSSSSFLQPPRLVLSLLSLPPPCDAYSHRLSVMLLLLYRFACRKITSFLLLAVCCLPPCAHQICEDRPYHC